MTSVIFLCLTPLLSAVVVFLQNLFLGARKENLEGEEALLLSGMFELCFAKKECETGLCKIGREGDKSEVIHFVFVPHTFLASLEFVFGKLSFAVTKGVTRTELIPIKETDRMVDMLNYSTAATRRYTNDECDDLVHSVTETRGNMCLKLSKAVNVDFYLDAWLIFYQTAYGYRFRSYQKKNRVLHAYKYGFLVKFVFMEAAVALWGRSGVG